jgi:DNA polymerase-3 subunit alpha
MIHLHGHSHYSVLDGLGKVGDIVARAKEIGAPAIAITDHASISCAIEFDRIAKENGIKPLFGVEFYVVDDEVPSKSEKRYHLIVLAKNYDGVKSIYKMLSKANQQFYRRPRITIDDIFKFENCVISTACSSGILARNDYMEIASKLRHTYGEDFYVEIMPFSLFEGEIDVDLDQNLDLQRLVNERALEINSKLGVKLIGTNDYHYVRKDDAYTHDILLAIQSGKTLDDPTRWKFNSDQMYIKDIEEMAKAFKELGYIPKKKIEEALITPFEIADKCNVEFPNFTVDLPSPYPDRDDKEVFTALISEGFNKLASIVKEDDLAKYQKQLLYEIEVINRLGVLRYFLIVADIVNWAKAQGIEVGAARGSAGGSLVAYLLNITQIDPIKHSLYFERFMNPERIDLPDIDIDFQDNRRHEVFDYIKRKYGEQNVAHISTFGYLLPKNAFRDVCRVFGVNIQQVNILSKQIEGINSFDEVPDLIAFGKKYPQVIEQIKKLIGTIRQVGVHAAGIVISSQPINNVGYLERRGSNGGEIFVVNWDKNVAEYVGLLKIDVLGLTTLTTLNKAKELVKKRHNKEIDISKIDIEDEKPYALSKHGATVGIFQFEGDTMRSLLRALSADNFNLITDATALIRPGSFSSGQTDFYVKVQRGDEYPHYDVPQLKPILEETNSVMVYQEQIMRIFVELGGFSWAHADKMRKIIGKKLGEDEFNKHKGDFISGCVERGIDENVASQIFEKMAKFASYSFNKAHAVGYSYISYYCMFFKYYFPLEYMCALLTTAIENSDNVEKYAKEAKKLGIEIELPDINRSTKEFVIDYEKKALIPPFSVIKGFGDSTVEAIIDERNKGGSFLSLGDFLNRINKVKVNKAKQQALVDAGAFMRLGEGYGSHKRLTELLPFFNETPTLKLELQRFDVKELGVTLSGVAKYFQDDGLPFLNPYLGANYSGLMFINNAPKSETEHFSYDGTKYLLKALDNIGIKKSQIYYTSLLKHCFYNYKEEMPKDYQALCKEVLLKEIAIIRPKLIVNFCSDIIADLHQKDKMSNLVEKIIYNKTFDAYVLFSWSPQFASYRGGEIEESFNKTMQIIKEIYNI